MPEIGRQIVVENPVQIAHLMVLPIGLARPDDFMTIDLAAREVISVQAWLALGVRLAVEPDGAAVAIDHHPSRAVLAVPDFVRLQPIIARVQSPHILVPAAVVGHLGAEQQAAIRQAEDVMRVQQRALRRGGHELVPADDRRLDDRDARVRRDQLDCGGGVGGVDGNCHAVGDAAISSLVASADSASDNAVNTSPGTTEMPVLLDWVRLPLNMSRS